MLKVSWYLSTQLPLGHFLSMIVVKGMIYISQLELWPSISQHKPTTNTQIFLAGSLIKYFLTRWEIFFASSTNISMFFSANKFSWFYPGLVWSFSIFYSYILAAGLYIHTSLVLLVFLSSHYFFWKLIFARPGQARKNVLKYFQNFPAKLKMKLSIPSENYFLFKLWSNWAWNTFHFSAGVFVKSKSWGHPVVCWKGGEGI